MAKNPDCYEVIKVKRIVAIDHLYDKFHMELEDGSVIRTKTLSELAFFVEGDVEWRARCQVCARARALARAREKYASDPKTWQFWSMKDDTE